MQKLHYPFSAIVGQERMRLALLLNAINPKIGGVLIEGEKGTAKSTAVRSLASILPPLDEQGTTDKNGLTSPSESNLIGTKTMTVVELPLNATEDRVVGTINLEVAIQEGKKEFEPGILEKAHRQFLYVDEVNLLDDHIVDILLDVAAMGINTVEREGISHSHPSQFVLVGTMNPEEGDLRPQLLDRFGLSVTVEGEREHGKRVEIMKRRLAFESNREEFVQAYAKVEKELALRVRQGRALLNEMIIGDDIFESIALIAIHLGVDGHRADITMLETAKAYAAWHGRQEVDKEDILDIAELVLSHRMRRQPFEERTFQIEEIRVLLKQRESGESRHDS